MLKIWSWRQAIAKAKLEANTKLVLYTLANYMNEHGQGCYPSLDTLQAETSLARATVCRHIELAIHAGFLSKKIHGYNGQGWARNEYLAMYPMSIEGSSTIEPPLEKGSSTDNKKAVQPLNSNSPLNTPLVVDDREKLFLEISVEIQNRMMGRILNTQRVYSWIESGADKNLILQVIDSVMSKREDPPNSLRYFEQAIADAVIQKKKPMSRGKQNGYSRNEAGASKHSGFAKQDYTAGTEGFEVIR